MKLAAYLRVSTAMQAEEGLGLALQERAVRTWARSQGHRIVATYRDEGVSGANGLAERVGLLDAFDALRSGRAGGIVVARLDRLARDLVTQESLLREAWNLGAEVFTTAPGEAVYLHRDDPEDPSRQLVRQVLGAVSSYERAMVVARLRAGRRRKAERGGFAGGKVPYGYRAEARELVAEAGEQATLARMRALRADGASYRAIVAALDAEGRTTRKGTRWNPAGVRAVLLASAAPTDAPTDARTRAAA